MACGFPPIYFLVSLVFSDSGVASSISEGDIFIYSCSAQLSSFEIKWISKEINCPEHEYMNMPPHLSSWRRHCSQDNLKCFTLFSKNYFFYKTKQFLKQSGEHLFLFFAAYKNVVIPSSQIVDSSKSWS